MIDLTGKVAVVTGAGSGIGREIAHTFAALGAVVVATDLNGDGVRAAVAEMTGTAVAIAHDVTEEGDWSRVMAATRDQHGRLDILVNCAGIMMSQPFADAPIDYLRRQQRINVESVYMGMHAALPLMQNGASIINIASVYGKVGGLQFAAYSATKGAVRALSKAVAGELAASGIRVNCILPGPVATNLGASWAPPVDADGQPLTPEQGLAMWTRLIPMGRLGQASDIAPLAAFLASDLASFVTGAEFIADGGYTAV